MVVAVSQLIIWRMFMSEIVPDGRMGGSKEKSAIQLKYSFKTMVINVLDIIERYSETILVRDPLVKKISS